MSSLTASLSVIKDMVCIVLFALKYILFALFAYQFFISVFGWVKRKEKNKRTYPDNHSFALIVAAHNEEAVIRAILSNLKSLDYPEKLYDIYVIADNCSDNTASIAREKGVFVFERTDAVKKGKGYAIEWMLEKLSCMDKQYDAICIFDADNLVSLNFLKVMNAHLHKGHKVVQAYLDSKNPYDSWISCNYSAAYWISNRIFQLPRYYLGLSCALGGTGFMASMDVIREIGWNAKCLTEDLEFSLQLVLKGEKVYWSHDAAVYDEKPLNLKQSLRQRKRWMQGQADCTVRYLKPLLLKALKDRDMVALDCAIYLLQPLTVIVGVILTAAYIVESLLLFHASDTVRAADVVSLLTFLLLPYSSIVFIAMESKLSYRIFKQFLLFPLFGLSWIPAIIRGYMDKDRREWAHTLHTRALDIADMKDIIKKPFPF